MESTSGSWSSHIYVRRLVMAVLVLAVVALGAYTYKTLKEAQYTGFGPNIINVRGEGEVLALPDLATFTFSVTAEAEDAETAQSQSAEASNAIVAYLTENGIAEQDIKTRNYNLNPRYEYPERICVPGTICPSGERVLVGYTVTQSVEVKVRDTDRAGSLISGVGERGATNVSSLRFTIDDESMLMAEAREAAINDAKQRARDLADDLGVRIVRMTGFYEETNEFYPYGRSYGGDAAAAESAVVNPAPNLPSGENKVTSRVNITYEIR